MERTTLTGPALAGPTLGNAWFWIAALSDAVMMFDTERRYAYLNAPAERLVGLPAAAVLGRTVAELVAAKQGFFGCNSGRCLLLDKIVRCALSGRSLRDDETGVILPDGTPSVLSWSTDPVHRDGRIVGAAFVARDMTRLCNATFLTAPVGMVRVRGNGEVLEANRAFHALLDLSGERTLFRPLRSLVHPADAPAAERLFRELIAGQRDRYTAEHRFRHTGGGWVWCRLTMTMAFRDGSGDRPWSERAVGVVEDISEQKILQAQIDARTAELEWLSQTDALTGLANRRQLDERLTKLSDRARRRDESLAVVMFDLDNFKSINDRYGHHAGDAVLKAVAERLRAGTRAGDLVGRWGGEEFLLLAPSLDGPSAGVLGTRLCATIAAVPISIGPDLQVRVTASAGAAAGSATAAADLIRRADAAMYRAKSAGRNRLVVAAEAPG